MSMRSDAISPHASHERWTVFALLRVIHLLVLSVHLCLCVCVPCRLHVQIWKLPANLSQVRKGEIALLRRVAAADNVTDALLKRSDS